MKNLIFLAMIIIMASCGQQDYYYVEDISTGEVMVIERNSYYRIGDTVTLKTMCGVLNHSPFKYQEIFGKYKLDIDPVYETDSEGNWRSTTYTKCIIRGRVY